MLHAGATRMSRKRCGASVALGRRGAISYTYGKLHEAFTGISSVVAFTRHRSPHLLRAVRAWLTPVRWHVLCRHACSAKPLPQELTALLEFLLAGCGINLYLRL